MQPYETVDQEDSRMKKMWLLSPFFLSMLSLPLCAEDLAEGDVKEKSNIAKGALFMQKKSHKSWGKNCMPQDKDCTSCCLPEISYRLPADFNGYNTFVEALVWQVQEQASHFVATPNNDSALHLPTTSSALHGRIQSASFDWNGGVRVGFGYTFVRDAWQALAQYTWYHTEGDNEFSEDGPITPFTTEFLMATFTNLQGGGLLEAKNSAHFTYQMADVLMARRFLVKDRIQLNFSLGATGGYIKEKFHVTYRNASMNTYVANSWAFGGGGLRTGIDANWHIVQGFGFFGKLSFAAILGNYGSHNRITADRPGISSFAVVTAPHIADVEYSGIFLLPTTQIALGFDWYRSFTNCWVSGVKVAVAGEFNHLSNLQQVFKTTMDATAPNYPGQLYARDVGSVYMYGANVRVGADF
jgi:hypothetical protein